MSDSDFASVPRIELAPGYSISRVIQGCWQFSEGHRLGSNAVDSRAHLVDLLAQRALDGKTTFDCADIYTGVEELLGSVRTRILELGGEQPQIHTKCVPDLDRLATLRKIDLERSIDRSLHRLGVERLDLVQFHWWDLSVPGSVQAGLWLSELQQAGKIRHLGGTNFTTPALAELIAAGVPIVAHQVQYSILDQRPATAMASLCREHDVKLLCYGSLAGGLLTSRFLASGLPDAPRNRSEVKYRLMVDEAGGWSSVARVLAQLEGVGRHSESGQPGGAGGFASRSARAATARSSERQELYDELIAPLAVRWVLEQPSVGAAIVGASRDRDLSLAAVTDLSPGVVAALADLDLSSLTGVPGDVYQLERDRDGKHGSIMRYNLQTD